MPARISAFRERPSSLGAQEDRRPITPPAQQPEPAQDQSNQTHNETHQARAQSHHTQDRLYPAHDCFWRWCEGTEASGPGGQEKRDAPDNPKELPKSWTEGEGYFSQGVKEQFLREMREYVRGQMS